MIRIGILGHIGSGKSYIAKQFGYPVFDADQEVSNLYKKNKSSFKELKKILPNYVKTFPIRKDELVKAIIDKNVNLKKINKVIHPKIRKKMNNFLNKNKKKKLVILDIPLLLENKLNKKNDILIFVQAKRKEIYKNLKKRGNFNIKLIKKFKQIQSSIEFKKKKSDFVIKNNFKHNYVRKNVKQILKKIL